MVPATYDVVVATIPGTDPAAGEVVLTAHLCHESAGANDNASGSAAILEVARALAAAIRKQALPPPRRTIRFLWLPEITGSQAYLVRHPEIVARLVAGVHMDMVGGLLATTKGTFHLSRTAETPAARRQRDRARPGSTRSSAASARYAEGRGDAYAGFVWPPGSREAFLGDIRGLEHGQRPRGLRGRGLPRADGLLPRLARRHDPHAEGPAREPRRDQARPRRLHGRRASSGRSPRCPTPRPPRLLAVTRADVESAHRPARRPRAGRTPRSCGARRSSPGIETLESVARLGPSTATAVAADIGGACARACRLRVAGRRTGASRRAIPRSSARSTSTTTTTSPTSPAPTCRTPRSPSARTATSSPTRRSTSPTASARSRRSATSSTGRYAPVPLPAVAEYFDLLAKAGAVRLSP